MRLLYVLTFVSGFAALVYQILWVRELTLILGSTTVCISTVVAAFMAGLALGSAVLGRWVDRRAPRTWLVAYAMLEIGIALAAILVMGLLPLLQRVYPEIVDAGDDRGGLLAAVRFVLTFALLLVPTSLMGGTFPVLVKIGSSRGAGLGRSVGMLYGVNTAGAVAGCFCAGLVLIEVLGVEGTYGVAIALNVLVGLAALVAFARRKATDEHLPAERAAPVWVALAPARGRALIILAAGATGGIALGYEIVWSRALSIVLGHSIYAFTFVLSTYLSGLALGGMLVAPWLDRLRHPGRALAAGLLTLAVVAAVSLYSIPLLPFAEYEPGVLWWDYVLKNLGSTALLLLPPTLIMGAILPTAIRAYISTWDRAGGDVGAVYAANTIGSIAGSLLTGFVLIPMIWTQPAFLVLVGANVLLALAVGAAFRWGRGWYAIVIVAAAAVVFALATSGASNVLRSKALAKVGATPGSGARLLYYGEDHVTLAGLVEYRNGMRMIFTNGSLMTHWGIETFWMSHLPISMAAEPRDVLVLCLGMGNTYVGAAQHPLNVTAVELSPQVVAAFGRHLELRGSSEEAASGGRGRIVVGDARNAVLVSQEQFDVITVDPPPPLYAAGTANFHTEEFYRLAKARLRPGGVMCQWIPFRSSTVDEYRILLKSFRVVFDDMRVWVPANRTGAYLLGTTMEPGSAPDGDEIRRRLLASPIVPNDLRRVSTESVESAMPIRSCRRAG